MFNSLSIRKPTLYFSAILFICLCAVTAQAKKVPKFKVIVFYSASYDQAHISYAHEFNAWIPAIAAKYNFSVDSTKDWKNLNTAYLAQYQVVLFLDNQPPASQRADFQKYMENGGGWIGFHVSAFTQRPEGWSWFYNDFLGSGSYKSNTWRPTSAVLKIEDRKHPATKKMPETFKSSPNEWYAWKNDLKANPNIDIIASIDPSSFPLGTGPKLNEIWHEGYYPVVWTNKNYKMMYFNMGHNDIDYEHKYDNTNKTLSHTLDNNIQDRMLINAIMWMGTKKK